MITSANGFYSSTVNAAAMLFSLFLLTACSPEAQKTTDTEPYLQSAQLIEVTPNSHYLANRSYIGKINSTAFSQLRFEYAGKIESTLVNSGDQVQQGQVLAKQDTQLLTIKLAELAAQRKQTQANIQLNQSNLVRYERLINEGYTAQQRVDELKAEQQVLQAKIQQLDASIDSINFQISRSKLIAPFTGTISKRYVTTGEIASPNTAAFSIIKSDNEEIVVGIPAKIANKLSINSVFNATIGEQKIRIKLINIGQQIDSVVRTVELRFVLLEKIKHFNDQLARVQIDYQVNKRGIWLPTSALIDGVRGQWNVYLATASENATYQISAATVKVLHANQEFAYVTGLADNKQLIIKTGVHRYVPGQTVKVENIESLLISPSGEVAP